MPIQDKNRVYDGWLSLEGGVDAGRAPDTIEINQGHSAINITFRGGPTTRPGFRKLTEQFPSFVKQKFCYNQRFQNDDVDRIRGEYVGREGVPILDQTTTPPTVPPNLTHEHSEFIYRNGILQCAQAYSPHNGEDCIVALIGGRLFKIVPGVGKRSGKGPPAATTAKVTEIVIEENNVPKDLTLKDRPRHLRNMKRLPIAYMVQADKWLIAQDGMSRPIIYDAVKARRTMLDADIDHAEIPVGTIMAYGMGRIVVVVNERDVAFGDLYGSHDLPDPADSLLFFTERNFLAEGFDAAIPFQQGVATGAIFFPQLDTSTGNGQLMVFAERGATSFFLSLPREQWKTSQFQVLSLLTTGLRGHRSISVVNEDLWFRSDDGMRSYRQARSEPAGWAHIPLSTNVRQFLENDSNFLLRYASSMYFDNRVLVTTSPRWNDGRPSHYGVVVVDFDILSSFGGSATTPQISKPAWEGQWLNSGGFMPVQVLTGTFNGLTRAFMFALGPDGMNQLFELSTDDKDDWDAQRINWELITRSFDFQKLSQQSTPFNEVEVYDADLWLKDIIE